MGDVHNQQDDVLEEVPKSQWPELRDLFVANLPRDFLAYSTLNNHVELANKKTGVQSKVLCLNGDWSDGTFLLEDRDQLCIYTLEESCQRLKKALLLLDWSRGRRVHPYDVRHKEALNSVFEILGLNIDYDSMSKMNWMSKDQAEKLAIETPDDVYVGPVLAENTDMMNSRWPHRFEGSDGYLRRLVESNVSRGVYGKQDGALRAWVLRMNNGFLTALHTHPDHVRKGYGTLVLKSIAMANANEGKDTVGCIVDGNEASAAMFRKAGFQEIGTRYWARCLPCDTHRKP